MYDSIEQLKDQQHKDQKEIDEVKIALNRLRKYEEFFNECNRKLLSQDLVMRTIEKKFKEETNSLNT